MMRKMWFFLSSPILIHVDGNDAHSLHWFESIWLFEKYYNQVGDSLKSITDC